jgi:hypothetical protein
MTDLIKNPTVKDRARVLKAWLEAGSGPRPGEAFRNSLAQSCQALYRETSSLCSQVLSELARQGVLERVQRGVWRWNGHVKPYRDMVFKASAKGLRNTKLEADDRFVFVETDAVLWWKTGAPGALLQLDMFKTLDSHLEATVEPLPAPFTIKRRLLPSAPEYVARVSAMFNVTVV